MIWIVKNLWLIPALPLLAAGIIAVNKQPARKLAASLAIGSMALGFLLSLCAFSATLGAAVAAVGRRLSSRKSAGEAPWERRPPVEILAPTRS